MDETEFSRLFRLSQELAESNQSWILKNPVTHDIHEGFGEAPLPWGEYPEGVDPDGPDGQAYDMMRGQVMALPQAYFEPGGLVETKEQSQDSVTSDPLWATASRVLYNYLNPQEYGRENIDGRSRRGTSEGQISPGSFMLYDDSEERVEENIEKDFTEYANWGVDFISLFENNLSAMAIDTAQLMNAPIEVHRAMYYMMESADRKGVKWSNVGKAFAGMATDPFTYFGLGTLGIGLLGKQAGKKLTKMAFKDMLKNSVRLVQPTKVSALASAEGALWMGAFDLARQNVEVNAEVKDEIDKTQLGTSALLGAGMGQGITRALDSVPQIVTNIADEITSAGDAATARMAERGGGTQLNTGFDVDPLLAAAGDLVGGESYNRNKRTGQYIGAPQGLNSPEKLASLRVKTKNLALEGEKGKFWYERSGKAILDAVGGNVDEADKIIQAIAVTSPSTPVKANFDYAIQAYSAYKLGKPIQTGRFPTAMSERLEKIFAGEEWAGRKTDDFYNNLMVHIDPSRSGPVTGDLWMMRAFGFTGDMPSQKQYEFVTKETQRIANELGWEPHQVQASMWVALKSRMESRPVKKLTEEKSMALGHMRYDIVDGKKKRVIINKEEHRKIWFAEGMKHLPTSKEKAAATFDYSTALRESLAQISWESIPGRTSGHMPEIFDAPYEVKSAYHVDISKAFLDENGTDILARELGLVSPGDFEAPGYFEGLVSPGTQTEVSAPRQYKGPDYGEVDSSTVELINAYATARGILMKQDGVGWHRPFYNSTKKDANGIELRIDRQFSETETAKLADILKELSGHGEYNPIATENGVRILNFDYLEFDNKEFAQLVKKAYDILELDDNSKIDPVLFNSQNGYVANDWSVSKNGEEYTDALRGTERPDIHRKVHDVIKKLQARIDDVDAEYSAKYGFTRNTEINTQFRDADGSGVITDAPVERGADGN